MSKKQKAIGVTVNPKKVNGIVVDQVEIDQQLVGTIQEVDGQYIAQMAGDQHSLSHTKDYDESLQSLLAAYHLHKG